MILYIESLRQSKVFHLWVCTSLRGTKWAIMKGELIGYVCEWTGLSVS